MEASQQADAPAAGIHEPFTRAERMQQLNEIDMDIVSLIDYTGQALKALSKEPGPAGDDYDPKAHQETFRTSMNAFLDTLHSVDVRLKRQIMGLEEAGIITLRDAGAGAKAPGGGGAGTTAAGAGLGGGIGGIGAGLGGVGAAAAGVAAAPTSLEPDGVGQIGRLDVGWLNSRSSKVERDMEAELWKQGREHLEALAREKMGRGDVKMGGS